MSRYLDSLFERAADRVADRLADRVAFRLESRIATLEILSDEDALEDLRLGVESSDDELRDYDEIRREAGLA